MKQISFLLFTIIFCLQAFCAPWTFMIYIMASPDMEDEVASNLYNLSLTGSNSNVEIYAQIDWTKETPGSIKKNYIPNPYYTGVARYRIDNRKIVLLEELGEANMGDEKVFWKFLDSSTPKASTNCMLLLGGHGSGFESWHEIPALDSAKCISYDDKENDSLTVFELEKSLTKLKTKTYGPLKFLMFDSCLMVNLPLLYQMRKCVEYVVGSDSGLYFGNCNYQNLVYPISNNPDIQMKDLAVSLVESFGSNYISHTKGSVTACFYAPRAATLLTYASWLADEMIKTNTMFPELGISLFGTPARYCDIGELVSSVSKNGKLHIQNDAARDLSSLAESFLKMVEDSRIAFEINGAYHFRNLCGLSLWFPAKPNYEKSRSYFLSTAFGKESTWGKFLDWRYGMKQHQKNADII